MIDLTKILNTDAIITLRSALCSHVYWQLSDPLYRNDGYVRAPGSDDPEKVTEILEACELDAALSEIAGDDMVSSCLPGLYDDITELEEKEADPVYRCACSWVGGDPDIGKGRGSVRYSVAMNSEKRIMGFRKEKHPVTRDPTCPACWAKNKKRVTVSQTKDVP